MPGPDTVSSGSDFFGVETPDGTGAPGSVGVAAGALSASSREGVGAGFGQASVAMTNAANNAGQDAAYDTATPITPDQSGGYHLTRPAGGSGEHIPNPDAGGGGDH